MPASFRGPGASCGGAFCGWRGAGPAVALRRPSELAVLAATAGQIDSLVNKAGDIPGGSLDKIDEPIWRHAWDLKVFGFINLTRLIYARMKAQGHGVIVGSPILMIW